MQCPNCQQDVPTTAKVCGYCGVRLVIQKPDASIQPSHVSTSPEKHTPPPIKRRTSLFSGWSLIVGVAVVLFCVVAGLIGLFLRPNDNPDRSGFVPSTVPPLLYPTNTVMNTEQPKEIPTDLPVSEPTSDPNSLWPGWPVYDGEFLKAGENERGEYSVAMSAPPEFLSSSYVFIDPGSSNQYGNFEAAVNATVTIDAQSTAIGLGVRCNEDWNTGCLLFLVRPFQGNYSIDRRLADGSWESIRSFVDSPDIQWIDDSFDCIILVVAKGNQFQLFYNDRLLDEVTVPMPAEGHVGIAVAVGNDGFTDVDFTAFSVKRR